MKFRLVDIEHYVPGEADCLVKFTRPALQVKCLFFWITLKKFLYDDKGKAYFYAKRVLNILNKENDL